MRKLLCIATVIAALKSLMHSIIVTLIPTLTNTDSPCPASCRHPRLKMRVKSKMCMVGHRSSGRSRTASLGITQPSTERSARPWGRPESPAVAGGAVGARVELHVLDEILHASARAIDLFVEDFRADLQSHGAGGRFHVSQDDLSSCGIGWIGEQSNPSQLETPHSGRLLFANAAMAASRVAAIQRGGSLQSQAQ
jgi:hypothetical protein